LGRRAILAEYFLNHIKRVVVKAEAWAYFGGFILVAGDICILSGAKPVQFTLPTHFFNLGKAAGRRPAAHLKIMKQANPVTPMRALQAISGVSKTMAVDMG
jgi:hypothetical protein